MGLDGTTISGQGSLCVKNCGGGDATNVGAPEVDIRIAMGNQTNPWR